MLIKARVAEDQLDGGECGHMWTPPGLQGDSSGPQSWVNINTLSMEIIQSYNRKVDNPIRSQNIVDNLQLHTKK